MKKTCARGRCRDKVQGRICGKRGHKAVAYPELVSRGVSKTRKFKWLVKVGDSIYQIPDLKKSWLGGFRATNPLPPPPWIRHCKEKHHTPERDCY